MPHEQTSAGTAPPELMREIEEIITALTERGFYVMRPEGVATAREPKHHLRLGSQTSH